MFKSIRVFINKKDELNVISDQNDGLGLCDDLCIGICDNDFGPGPGLGSQDKKNDLGNENLELVHQNLEIVHQNENENNRLPLSDLPEDLLVLERREKEDFIQTEIENESSGLKETKIKSVKTGMNDEGNRQDNAINYHLGNGQDNIDCLTLANIVDKENQGPILNDERMIPNRNVVAEQNLSEKKEDSNEQKSLRVNHCKNYVGYKSKKVYFDNMDSNESFFKYIIQGESVGILIGSVGISSPANKHAVLEKLAKEVKVAENANLIESCQIFMGRFAITDTKLMDLNSERNVPIASYIEKTHVTQKITAAELKKLLASPSLTSLSSCTILYFKWSQNIVGKLYLIDVKEPDFGMTQEDLGSSSISLKSLQGKLRESMLKLSNIVKVLGNAGAEGFLDFKFPLGVCSREIFGGRAHAFLSFDLMDTTNVSDSQLSHFLEFCSASRRIRNRIESNSIDSTLISLNEKFSQLESNFFEKRKEVEEKENKILELTDTCKDLNELADQHRQEISNLNSQLSELTLQGAEQEREYALFQAEIEGKLDKSVKEYQSHLEKWQQDKQQSNLVQVQALKESVAAAERVNSIEAQLLKTKVLEYQTLLLETQEENRTLLSKNAILEYERSHYTENISFYTTLHEKDLASILKAKRDLADLHAELHVAVEKFDESQILISSLKDESRDLTKQLVVMQQQLLDRTDTAFAQANKQDQKLYNEFLAKQQQMESLKSQLDEAELAKMNLQSQVEKIQMKLSTTEDKYASKQEEFSNLKNLLEKIENKYNSIVEENALLRDKVDEFLANDAVVTRNGLQQTLSLLETRLDNSIVSNTTSNDQISYQEKLEEARRAQLNMMEKMIERESAWAKEKQELLLVKKNSEEISAKSQKRSIAQVDQELNETNSDVQTSDLAKKAKSKKTSDNGVSKACLKSNPKAPKTKKAKKIASIDDEEGTEDVDENEIEEKRSNIRKEKSVQISKTIELAKAKISSNIIKEILNTAEGQNGLGPKTHESDSAIAIVKKKISKKNVPSIPSVSKNILQETTNGDGMKENSIPLNARKDFFSKKDSSYNTASVPKLGGLLSGFLKRPVANSQDAGASNPESQLASLEEDAAVLLPKIPQKYLDKRRLDMIAGGQ